MKANFLLGDRVARIAGLAAVVSLVAGSASAQTANVADICKDRKPCSLVKATPAGKDAQGRALTVVELNLGPKNNQNDSGDARFNCRPFKREFWVRVQGVAAAQNIMTLCNDGYGAASIGADTVRIQPNRIVHSQQGGSAWRWNNGTTYELSPLRVLSDSACSYHNVNIGYSITQWDWQKLAGERRWLPQACKENEARANKQPDWCDQRRVTRRQAMIPRLDGAMPAGALSHLGSCASAFDESGKKGFVVFGQPRANGAELRVLMTSGRDLVVSVTDSGFATGGANWLADDHVELWVGTDQSNLSCNESTVKLSQWAIGLDGKINHASGDKAGAPELVGKAERSVGNKKQVTMHLRLPESEVADYGRAITVVYSKSADGKQARLTATSPVKRGDETTLGSTRKIDAKALRCTVKDGQLDIAESGMPAGVRTQE